MNKKRAQVEIMGLIIIVILLAVAMIFILQFTISRRPETVSTYSDKQIAENMRTVLLQTTTNCYDNTISELLKKCAREELGRCPDNQDYCDFVKSKIDYYFEQTLEEWGRDYNFTVMAPPSLHYSKAYGPCKRERRAAQEQPIQVNGIFMTVNLYVCD
jgi:hypothetical protein